MNRILATVLLTAATLGCKPASKHPADQEVPLVDLRSEWLKEHHRKEWEKAHPAQAQDLRRKQALAKTKAYNERKRKERERLAP